MKFRVRSLATSIIALALVTTAEPHASFAQTTNVTTRPAVNPAPSGGVMGALIGGPLGIGPLWGRAIPGKPYSAETVQERSQTLADGTHINQTTQSRGYRDSQGRTRSEGLPALLLEGGHAIPFVTINDPVAGVRYVLDMQRQVARRYPMPAQHENRPQVEAAQTESTDQTPPARPKRVPTQTTTVQASTEPADETPRRRISHVSLGKQTIEGIEAVGLQTTITIPAGAEGNDRAIEVVCENWDSPEMTLMMISKCADPLHGDHTTRIVSIDRSEPDPSLFQVPPGFTIEDQETRVVKESATSTEP